MNVSAASRPVQAQTAPAQRTPPPKDADGDNDGTKAAVKTPPNAATGKVDLYA